MSASAIVAATSPPRQRVAVIVIFWFMAATLIGAQILAMRYLGSLDQVLARTTGETLSPSLWWRMTGTLLPLLLAGTALALQSRWLEGVWGALAGFGLVTLVPFAPLCLLVAYIDGPRAVETIRVRAGGSVILAVEEGMDGFWFVLFDEVDSGGFIWRQVSEVDYLQDRPRADRPQLVAAPDGRWLLVRRAGIWTDAFRLVDGHPVRIDIPLPSSAPRPGNAALVRLRSERIAALTGLRP